MVTFERLKQCLHYEPLTGDFTWAINKVNVRAGDIAGRVAKGYIIIGLDGKEYRAHRLAWLYMTGEMPENEIDHINHIRHDNRWCNLRLVTRLDNCMNTSRRITNISGVTGVSFNNKLKKWHAQIQSKMEKVHLGYFLDINDAIQARKEAEIKYGFHENHGKFIIN